MAVDTAPMETAPMETAPMETAPMDPAPFADATAPSLPPAPMAPQAESQAELDTRVEKMLRAERFFRRGCRAASREDFATATQAFAHAVDLAPDEGEFLAHLGRSRLLGPEGDTALAIDELRQAATMVPKMEQVQLWLARALRDAGQLAEARDAYGNALAANPDSHAALEELQALAPD